MKAQKSPLVLHNFFIVNQNYKVLQPADTNKINIKDFFDKYYLDIDFAFKQLKGTHFQLFTKIAVNQNQNPLPGYAIFIEGACLFSFSDEIQMSVKDKASLLHFSGLNICINSLRNIVTTVTSSGPFGRYILPAIDVKQLLADKKTIMEAKKK